MSKIAEFARTLSKSFPYATNLRITVELNSLEAATVLAAVEFVMQAYKSEQNDPLLKAVQAKVVNAMEEEAAYIGRNVNASLRAKLSELDPERDSENLERPSEERQDETDSGTE